MKVHIILSLTNEGFPYQELGRFFTDRQDSVKFATVDDRCHVEQLLVIPDTGGYDLTRAMFMPKHKLPPLFPAQDQQMQWFFHNQLQYFIDKKVKIFGIGTGALMLWDILHGKAIIEQGMPQLMLPVPHGVDVEYEHDRYQFRSGQFLGASHFTFSNKDYNMVREFVEGPTVLNIPGDPDAAIPALVE